MQLHFAKRMESFQPGIFNVLNDRKNEMVRQGREVFNLSVGTPDFSPDEHVMEAMRRACADPNLYKYSLGNLPTLVEDVRWTFDEAMIKLRSAFQRPLGIPGETNDVDYIIDLLSHMSVDQSIKSDDNGVTQTVQVRKGISFVENKAVRPIVTLAPYRTFQEVQQPASEFVFRVYEDRSISLTAADGGMWKLAARDAAKRYLTDALADEIEKGLVIVTL